MTASTGIDASLDTTLWVEATSTGSGNIALNWSNDASLMIREDLIKLTAFQWSGPLNVPGYAKYQYEVDGAPAGGQWLDPIGGPTGTTPTIAGRAGDVILILWGAGGDVEQAVYQANANFSWGLQVNVVKIDINSGSLMTIQNPPVQHVGTQTRIDSNASYAMDAQLSVNVTGATVGTQVRGAKFLEMGFIQNLTPTSWSADYNALPKQGGAGGNGRRRRAMVENAVAYLDQWNGSAGAWYDSNNVSSSLNVGIAGIAYFAPDDTPIVNKAFRAGDRPWANVTDDMRIAEGGPPDGADRFDLVWDFVLSFVVHTKQTATHADWVYTKRAAKDWHFNGSGTVIDGGPNDGVWNSPNANTANSGSGTFAPVTDGEPVEVHDGKVFNQAVNPLHFETVNQ